MNELELAKHLINDLGIDKDKVAKMLKALKPNELTNEDKDFLASCLNYIRKLNVWTPEQKAKAKTILDKLCEE